MFARGACTEACALADNGLSEVLLLFAFALRDDSCPGSLCVLGSAERSNLACDEP